PFENYLRIDHLDRPSAEEAIRRPLEEYNRRRPGETPATIEEELVEAVLNEVGSVALGPGRGSVASTDEERIEAPYLQLVMTSLWDTERERSSFDLHLRTFVELGGAASIIRNYLDEKMSALPIDEQEVASSI